MLTTIIEPEVKGREIPVGWRIALEYEKRQPNQNQGSRKIWASGGPGQPTIYYDENGNLISVSGDRNWRNNNPGNIE